MWSTVILFWKLPLQYYFETTWESYHGFHQFGYSIFFNVEVGSQVLLEHDSIQLSLLCRFSSVRGNLCKIPAGSLFVKGFLTFMCHECIQGDWWLEKVSFSDHYKQDRTLTGKWRHICRKYFLILNGMGTLYQKTHPSTCVGLVYILQSSFLNLLENTAWKVSKYGVSFGPYFPVFSPNRENKDQK